MEDSDLLGYYRKDLQNALAKDGQKVLDILRDAKKEGYIHVPMAGPILDSALGKLVAQGVRDATRDPVIDVGSSFDLGLTAGYILGRMHKSN